MDTEMEMGSDRDPDRLLPLSTPVLHILLALTEGERHGYAILGHIRDRTDGEVDLSTSTLYGAIKRLMRDGLVERSRNRTDPAEDERRRYYRLTGFGREVLRAETRRIQRLADRLRHGRTDPRLS